MTRHTAELPMHQAAMLAEPDAVLLDGSRADEPQPKGNMPDRTAPVSDSGTTGSPESNQAGHRQSLSRAQWIIVLLLVVSVIINYVDRSNLSIAVPVLQRQLGLSSLQVGSLMSAFFWTYAVLQVIGVVGWLSDAFPVVWVLAIGYMLWSGATIATGLTSSFLALFLARMLLGVGESVAYPCYSRIFAELPQEHRGRANALIDAGTKLGPAIGAFVGGLLLIHLGWRMLFIVLGLGGCLWLVPWLKVMPKSRATKRDDVAQQASIAQLLCVPSAWGTFLGHFCGNYFFYFLLAWLPNYLVREEHLSLLAMSRLTSAVFLLIATSTIVAGAISDRLIAKGHSVTRVRRSVVAGGLALASVLAVLAYVHQHVAISLSVLSLACVGYGCYASNHWAISQTLAGPSMAGRWTSLQNGIANFSGIAAPWIAGWIAETHGSLRMAFVVSGGVTLAGAFFWALLVRRVEPVHWTAGPCPPLTKSAGSAG